MATKRSTSVCSSGGIKVRFCYVYHFGNRSSLVSVVTRLWAGRSGVPNPAARHFFLKTSRPTLGPTQLPVQSVVGPFSGGKVAGVGVDHSLPSRAEFQNEWSPTSTYSTCLYGVYRDDLIFTYLLSFNLNFLGPRFNERPQFCYTQELISREKIL
jgi:hypothetical protein